MKALVTGVVGFIGSHVAEAIQNKGFIVHGIDNFSNYYDVNLKKKNEKLLIDKGVKVFNIDLRHPEQLMNFDTDYDYIFHFAAQPGLSATSSFEDYFTNNFLATNNLLNFALKNQNLKLFINISTSSVYGLDATLNEEIPPKPASNYGVTKFAAEQLALSFSRNNLLKVCSLRLYSVYGPRERPDKLYPKLVKSAMTDVPFTLFEGSEKHLRSYTYVDDIVDGVLSVIGKENAVDGEIFNIGNTDEVSTATGIETVEKLTNRKITIKTIPKRSGDQLTTKAVIDKAKNILNYQPKINLEEG